MMMHNKGQRLSNFGLGEVLNDHQKNPWGIARVDTPGLPIFRIWCDVVLGKCASLSPKIRIETRKRIGHQLKHRRLRRLSVKVIWQHPF